jgi:hypothetical protein
VEIFKTRVWINLNFESEIMTTLFCSFRSDSRVLFLSLKGGRKLFDARFGNVELKKGGV